jgi:hypothetical protein
MPLSVVAKIAITAAMTAAQMALTMTQRIAGPRLESLDVTVADYGTAIPRFWGKRRFDAVPIIWAERLREEKNTSKTKGGKYDEYRYYGTFAVLICDHEIEAISRIWMDKHLVYDATSTGPLAAYFGIVNGEQAPVKIQRGRNMRIYLGTETQEPDPRMEAWCEDRYGADSCPAYRGSAYVVFQDLPLEKFGNRIPQISIEAINSKDDSYPYEVEDSDVSEMARFVYSPDRSRFILNATTGETEIWDTATRTRLVSGSLVPTNPAMDSSGNIWAVGGTLGNTLYQIAGDSLVTLNTFAIGEFTDQVYCFGSTIYLHPHSSLESQYITFAAGAASVTEIPFDPIMYFEDSDGVVWAVGEGTNVIPFWSPGSYFTVATSTTGNAYALDNGAGSFFCRQGNTIYLIDKDTHTVTDSAVVDANFADTLMMFRNLPAGSASIWFQGPTTANVSEYSTETLALIQTIALTQWSGDDVDDMVYDPINHALITAPQFGTEMAWRYLDRVSSPGVTLESVVEDVAEWCGLDSVDATDLTQTVEGYSVTQGTGKDMIAPLLDIHDSIARPHDFSVQFLQLGDSSLGTLETEDFVRDENRYTITIQQDTDLPRRLTLNFADIGKDQQTNTVIAQRALDAVDSVRDQTIDMTTYVADPGDAQKFADRYFRRLWNGRESVSLGLTAQMLKLEPGDVYTLDLDGVSQTARLEKMTLAGGAIRTEWRRDFTGLHSFGTGAGAEMEGRDDDGIFVPAPTKGFVLDIPFIQDGDSEANPILYYGASAYGSGGWPGAVLYEDVTGTLSQWNVVESDRKAAWGHATEALATVSSPWIWDRGNSVNISLLGGTLTSCTEAEIDADPTLNLAAIGNPTTGLMELINFTTATLEADGTYTLSGFKRGRRGTEGYRDNHAIGDLFVLLSTFKTQQFGLSDVGDTLSFRAATLGRDPLTAFPFDATLHAKCLEPYAPVRFRAVRDSASGDWDFTWRRRTRLGGRWFGGTTIPLSESTESYELVIPTSGGTRTITAASQSATWTAAQQTTDYGGTQTSLPAGIAVYQMSDDVSRGFASEEPIVA